MPCISTSAVTSYDVHCGAHVQSWKQTLIFVAAFQAELPLFAMHSHDAH